MNKIYHHDDTMYVVANKVYVKTDGFAYEDSECTIKISAEMLETLFVEGMIIVDTDGAEYKPISCKVSNKVATVTYVTTDTSSPTTAKLATVKSK